MSTVCVCIFVNGFCRHFVFKIVHPSSNNERRQRRIGVHSERSDEHRRRCPRERPGGRPNGRPKEQRPIEQTGEQKEKQQNEHPDRQKEEQSTTQHAEEQPQEQPTQPPDERQDEQEEEQPKEQPKEQPEAREAAREEEGVRHFDVALFQTGHAPVLCQRRFSLGTVAAEVQTAEGGMRLQE